MPPCNLLGEKRRRIETSPDPSPAGKHFKETTGTLVFQSGETRQTAKIHMLPFDTPDLVAGMLAFRLTLSNPVGGVILGSRSDCRVVIIPGHKQRVRAGKSE